MKSNARATNTPKTRLGGMSPSVKVVAPVNVRVRLGGMLEPEVVDVGGPRHRRAHAVLGGCRDIVAKRFQKRTDDAFATASVGSRQGRTPAAHRIEKIVGISPE